MNISGVKYSGYLNAYSGMGSAARNFIQALDSAGVPVQSEAVANIDAGRYLGKNHELIARLQEEVDYDFKVLHTTPDTVLQHIEPLKKHIFHFFWETDKIPDWFVWALNLCDEVWTGCEWNRGAFRNSGVNREIWVCPQPVWTPDDVKPFEIKERSDFLFYSIFQWIERKDPKTLLFSFWKEFKDNPNVGLMIKTYKEKFTPGETQDIVNQIYHWKSELRIGKYPKIFLYPYEMSQPDVFRFHATGHAFVSSHRGEGWGCPQAEAMSLGRPVISTDLGGIHEAVPKEYFHGVDYHWRNVFGMDWVPWYEESQQWAQAEEDDLRAKMRDVYENYGNAQKKAMEAQEYVKSNLSMEKIGDKMKKRLIYLQGKK